ncbi:S8 family peptidase [Natronospora cellulosivora (SeqCode)]
MNKTLLISILFLFLIIFFITVIENDLTPSDLIIFVVDSWQEEEYIGGRTIYGEQITHGSNIVKTIKGETPKINIEIVPLDILEEGRGSYDVYLGHLQKVINYKEAYPEKRVIVNISLAFYNYDSVHHELIKKLEELGVGVIAAAGNDNSSIPIYPAGFEETIAVASAARRGKAEYSNYGEYIDIAANGNIRFSFLNYNYGSMTFGNYSSSGTSLAAPRVAGLLASVLAYDDKISVEQGMELIKKNSVSINDELFEQGFLGIGLINKRKVLSSIDILYYLRQTSFLQVIIFFLGIIFFVFSKNKVLDFFIIGLFFLVIFPLMFFIKDFADIIKNSNQNRIYFFLLLLILFLALTIVFIINEFKNEYRIKKYLKNNRNINIEYLLSVVISDKKVYNIIELYFQKNERYYLSDLIDSFIELDLEKKRILAKILISMESERVIDSLLYLFENDLGNLSHNTKLVLLEIFESLAETAELPQAICQNIILNNNEDTWLRYQALRTFFYTYKDKKELITFLKSLLKDREELISMEARGLLKELNN